MACMLVGHNEGVTPVPPSPLKEDGPLCLPVTMKGAGHLYTSVAMKEVWPLCLSVPLNKISSLFHVRTFISILFFAT